MNKLLFLLFISLISFRAVGQKSFDLQSAVQFALQNNPGIQAAELKIREARALRGTSTEMSKLSVTMMTGQYNSVRNDKNYTLTQSTPLPTTWAAQSRLAREEVIGKEKSLASVRNNLIFELRDAYDQLLYLRALTAIYITQDSIFAESALAASKRYRSGESTYLEKMTTEAQSLAARNQLSQHENDLRIQESRLERLMYLDQAAIFNGKFEKLKVSVLADTAAIATNPLVEQYIQQEKISSQFARVQRNLLLPDLTFGYFSQSLIGFQRIDNQDTFFDKDKKFTGYLVGFSIPLWARPQIARAKAAELNARAQHAQSREITHGVETEYLQSLQELEKNAAALNYYESQANQNAELIFTQAITAYKQGELSYMNFLQSLENVLNIKTGYLGAIRKYNQVALKINYLTGNHE
jgi:cobalt-zinc-cadmium resistance protein CzcA